MPGVLALRALGVVVMRLPALPRMSLGPTTETKVPVLVDMGVSVHGVEDVTHRLGLRGSTSIDAPERNPGNR